MYILKKTPNNKQNQNNKKTPKATKTMTEKPQEPTHQPAPQVVGWTSNVSIPWAAFVKMCFIQAGPSPYPNGP